MLRQHSHIVVIDPAAHTPEVDCFNNIARLSNIPCTYHLPVLQGMGSLHNETPDLINGIIILGSASSVHEKTPWQQDLKDWLLPHLDALIPTFGLCFGHQFIAHIFGGEIGYLHDDQRKLRGFREVCIGECGPFPDSQSNLVVSHNETVTKVPPNMDVFASSPEVPTDGLSHNSLPIWTLQAHPEATAAFMQNQSIKMPDDEHAFLPGHLLILKFLEFTGP